MFYEPESNIISIEIASGKIDNTIEMGNLIIHLTKNKKPVLIEILDGGKFIPNLNKITQNKKIKTIASPNL